MGENPLVADRVDSTSPLAGAGLLEDGYDLVQAVESGSWVDGGLAAFSFAVDTAAMVSDPLGSLLGAGLGWLIDHLSPLNEWLEDLTGDADQVRAFSRTWANVAEQLSASADEMSRKVRADLEDIHGQAADAYRALAGDMVAHLEGAAQWASGISTGLSLAATIVQVVHDLVRDSLAQLVGAIISWVAELAITVGLATPLVIEQVATRVASLAERLGTKITKLLSSIKNLSSLLASLKALLRRAKTLFDDLLPSGPHLAMAGGDVPSGYHFDVEPNTRPADSTVLMESDHTIGSGVGGMDGASDVAYQGVLHVRDEIAREGPGGSHSWATGMSDDQVADYLDSYAQRTDGQPLGDGTRGWYDSERGLMVIVRSSYSMTAFSVPYEDFLRKLA